MADAISADRLTRTASPDGSAAITAFRPDRRIADGIRQFAAYREERPDPVRRHERAQAHIVLIFDLGPTLRFLDPETGAFAAAHRGGFIAGLHGRDVLTETSGTQAGVQVNFSLEGALRCFGPVLGDLGDSIVALQDLLGSRGREMVERLHDAPDDGRRLGLVEDLLIDRFAAAPAASGLAVEGLRRLTARHGRAEIGALARDLDCSRKHLTQVMRRSFGLPPKQIARILRFNHAADLLEAADGPDIASVAAGCGYADQPHMTRDFVAFSGYPPASYLRRRLPGEHGLGAD